MAQRAATRLRGAGYLQKWIILGIVIGVSAGIGAIVFSEALHLATRFFLGTLGGYTPPQPFGEGNSSGSAGFARPWAIPLITGLGGLLAGILVFVFAPEAEGHGTDAAISAVHNDPKAIRGRVSAIKIVASALTIGSGGSGGREGPTAQISAGVASALARALDLTPADARVAVTVGIGAGIGAIFRAPLGGAILGAEVIYREDIEVPALLPSLIASVVGYAIFAAVEGFGPIFGSLVRFRFEHPAQLFYYALIGVVGAGMGILYSQSFYGAVRITKRLPGSRIIWPGVAGVLVGLMALALPGSLGTGYGWVQKAMGPALLTIPLWIVLLLPFAKILATSLSIGSGGSGGIFGPGMVIGGFMGAGIWRLLDSVGAPGIPHNPAPFVIVGMIACFGSIGRVPLAVMLMVGEMTGNLDLLIPAMIAVGIATFLIGDRTIYKSQLRNRAESPSQAFRFGLPMLDTIAVNEVVSAPVLVVRANQVAAEAAGQMRREHLASAPVVDEDGRFVGAVELKNVDRLGDSDDTARVGDFISRRSEAIPNTSSLADALEAIVEMQVSWVPVLDEQMQLVGVVGTSALLSGYQEVLRKDLTRAQPPARELVSLESRVNSTSSLVGTSIAEAGLPPGTIVVSVERNGHLSLPSDSFVFLPQDTINAFVPERSKEELRHLVETDVGGAQEEDGPDLV